MEVLITQEKTDTEVVRELVAELDAILTPLYPSESRHGYDIEKLVRQNVHFFVNWVDGEAAGCGGIELVEDAYGELKRMYVRPAYRGQQLGKRLVDHLCQFAQQHNIHTVRLETGIHQKAAIHLYKKEGFYRIPPFGDYFEDPNSRCYEKQLKIVNC